MIKKTTIIAIANQKGGVGKTTTAVNIAAGLLSKGKNVLCLDFDPQCNLGAYLGYKQDNLPTITDFLFSKAQFRPLPPIDGLIRTSTCGIRYIPASLALSKADMVLSQALFRERILADILTSIIPDNTFEYVIIDCNPSMGILLTNALVAADKVLIPIQTEEFAVSGLEDMMDLISIIKAQINPTLSILGLLPTMVSRNNVSKGIITELTGKYPNLLLHSQISRSVEAPKSSQRQEPLLPNSKIGLQYEQATIELLERMEA